MSKDRWTLAQSLTIILGGLPLAFIFVGGFTYWVVRTFVMAGKP